MWCGLDAENGACADQERCKAELSSTNASLCSDAVPRTDKTAVTNNGTVAIVCSSTALSGCRIACPSGFSACACLESADVGVPSCVAALDAMTIVGIAVGAAVAVLVLVAVIVVLVCSRRERVRAAPVVQPNAYYSGRIDVDEPEPERTNPYSFGRVTLGNSSDARATAATLSPCIVRAEPMYRPAPTLTTFAVER